MMMSQLSSLHRLAREPLFHFLLIGAAIFAGYTWLAPDTDSPAVSQEEIRLTLDDLAQLEKVFLAKWNRSPSPSEFRALIENRVREEVLYREALALGLDEDDTIVRRRMAQKMQFLAEDLAAAREPTETELRAWYQGNSALFALPARVSFRHLYFAADRRGEKAKSEAAAALAQLADTGGDASQANSLADPFMFQDYYGDRTARELARDFGPEFARAVTDLEPGAWKGPLRSGFGWHLVFVDSLVPGRIPAFSEVAAEVRAAWLGEQKALARKRAYRKIRAKYTLLLPVPPRGEDEGEEYRPPRTSPPDTAGLAPEAQ